MHHIINLQSIPGLSHVPLIYPFIRMGSVGVDVFMFLSGYCLSLSYARDPNLKLFYKKRVVRLLIPYFVLAIPYYLWRNSTIAALSSGSFNAVGFINDVSGLSFWLNGMMNSWFVAAIFVFYLLFPFLYTIVSKSKIHAIVTLILSYLILICAFLFSFPGFDNYAIAITRFPAFLLGIILAIYKMAPPYNRKTLIVSAVVFFLLMGVCPIKTVQEHFGLHGFFLWVPYILLVLPIVYLGRFLFAKWEGANLFWDFLGKCSLELYIVHVFLINILKWYGWNHSLGLLLWVVIPLVSIPLAYIVSLLSHKLQFLFFPPKKLI